MDLDALDIDEQLAILDEIDAEEKESVYSNTRFVHESGEADISESPAKFLYPLKRRKTAINEPQQSFDHASYLERRIPLSGNYIPFTFTDGRRRYLSIEPETNDFLDINRIDLSGLCNHKPLIPDKLCNLIQGAEQLTRLKRITTPTNPSLCDPIDGQLWTKKYEPISYLDLMSNENVNRQLLCWLKSWDLSVFGIEHKVPFATAKPQENSKDSVNGRFGSLKNQQFQNQEWENTIAQLDPKDGQTPYYRLVLLSGPPGLGKTTLAHLLARLAGYQVVETNASDDRSPQAMRERLEAVVSNQASLNPSADGTVGKALKPSCLILDEIDGALPAAVEVLAKAAAASIGNERAKRGKKSSLVLRRPVICICNDLFSPSLRPLRMPGASCYILRLPTIDLNRLVGRLESIALAEHVNVDKNFLSALAESSGRDIRSCLNILQFVKVTQVQEKQTPSVNELIAGLEGSVKDVQHNLFSAWQAVFSIPPARILDRRIIQMGRTRSSRATKHQGTGSASDSSLEARVRITLEVCNSAGEPQSLILGLFENYLNRRMKDASLQTARKASDWLAYSDHLFRFILSNQDYSLMRYTSILPGWFHLTFASTTPSVIESRWKAKGAQNVTSALHWPASFNENTAAASKTHSVVQSLLENQWRAGGGSSSLTSLRFLTQRQFTLDAANYLHKLVQAMSLSLRPVNTQLYTATEKEHLAHLTSLMITIGLDWTPHQTDEYGESTYCLEPPIDAVSQFRTSVFQPSEGGDLLPYAIKQMLARELALERLRRVEGASSSSLMAVCGGAEEMGFGSVATKLPASGGKSVPISDSFMAARLGPIAAPLNVPFENKVQLLNGISLVVQSLTKQFQWSLEKRSRSSNVQSTKTFGLNSARVTQMQFVVLSL